MYANNLPATNKNERFARLHDALLRALHNARRLRTAPLAPGDTMADRMTTTRLQLFDEALSALLAAWDGEPAEFVGHVALVAGQEAPAPYSRGIPIVGDVVGENAAIIMRQGTVSSNGLTRDSALL